MLLFFSEKEKSYFWFLFEDLYRLKRIETKRYKDNGMRMMLIYLYASHINTYYTYLALT